MDISHPPMPADFLGPFSSEEGHPWRQECSSALNEALRDWRGECPLGREGGSSDGLTTFSTPPPLEVLVCGYAVGLLSPESKRRETACLWSMLLLVSVEMQRCLLSA